MNDWQLYVKFLFSVTSWIMCKRDGESLDHLLMQCPVATYKRSVVFSFPALLCSLDALFISQKVSWRLCMRNWGMKMWGYLGASCHSDWCEDLIGRKQWTFDKTKYLLRPTSSNCLLFKAI